MVSVVPPQPVVLVKTERSSVDMAAVVASINPSVMATKQKISKFRVLGYMDFKVRPMAFVCCDILVDDDCGFYGRWLKTATALGATSVIKVLRVPLPPAPSSARLRRSRDEKRPYGSSRTRAHHRDPMGALAYPPPLNLSLIGSRMLQIHIHIHAYTFT